MVGALSGTRNTIIARQHVPVNHARRFTVSNVPQYFVGSTLPSKANPGIPTIPSERTRGGIVDLKRLVGDCEKSRSACRIRACGMPVCPHFSWTFDSRIVMFGLWLT